MIKNPTKKKKKEDSKTHYSLHTASPSFSNNLWRSSAGCSLQTGGGEQRRHKTEKTGRAVGDTVPRWVVRALPPARPALLAQARQGTLPAGEKKNPVPTKRPVHLLHVHTPPPGLTRLWDVLAPLKMSVGVAGLFSRFLSLRHSLVNTLMHILALSFSPQVSKEKKKAPCVTFSYFDTDVNIKSSSAK